MGFDLIIQGGTVVDGTGEASYCADLGIKNGEITGIGDLPASECPRVLDATNLVVTPGFIDIHSHSDFTVLVDPRAQSSIYQGVTTELIGNCGHGCAPITDPERFIGNIYGYTTDLLIDWHSYEDYIERLTDARPAINLAPLIPNGNLRIASVTDHTRPSTGSEIVEMTKVLEEAMQQGAYGYSSGLDSAVEKESSKLELIELAKVVAKYEGIYACHTRNKEVEAVQAIEEAIDVAEASRSTLQISHIIPRRGGAIGARERAIEAVENASKRGIDVGFDQHTREHGITNLSAALPPGSLSGDIATISTRLKESSFRDSVRTHESLIASFGRGGWNNVYVHRADAQNHLVGKSIADLTPSNYDAWDAILDILLAHVEKMENPMVVCHSYTKEEIKATLLHPMCTVGSDATALCSDGPLSGTDFPGSYTWAAWFYRHFVTEASDLTLEQAVRKLTAQPADRLGIHGRGRLQIGARADVAVFDPVCFRPMGTFDNPSVLAEGMTHVVVNGGVALRDGVETGARFGRVLRKGSA